MTFYTGGGLDRYTIGGMVVCRIGNTRSIVVSLFGRSVASESLMRLTAFFGLFSVERDDQTAIV